MTKAFKTYLLIWALAIISFNVIYGIVLRQGIDGNLPFIVGTNLLFVLALVSGYFAFKVDNVENLFLKMPMLYVSYVGLIIITLLLIWSLVDYRVPKWVCQIICIIVVVTNVIIIIWLNKGSQYIESVEKKYSTKISFLNESKKLIKQIKIHANDDNAKKLVNEIEELILYSKSSNDNTADIDNRILDLLNASANNYGNGASINENEILKIKLELEKRNALI